MHAGPEIGVAATKSFTSQLVILTLIGLLLGRMRHLSTAEGSRIIDALEALPEQIEEVLKTKRSYEGDREKICHVNGMLFFGRQFNFPIALEGALKMKEITYLFAEGHPSAELKHGIIALIRPDLPSVFIAPDDAVFSKNVNNIEQVKARKGPIIALTSGNGAKRTARDRRRHHHVPERSRLSDAHPHAVSRSSCSPITSPSSSAATSINRGTWPRASPSSNLGHPTQSGCPSQHALKLAESICTQRGIP